MAGPDEFFSREGANIITKSTNSRVFVKLAFTESPYLQTLPWTTWPRFPLLTTHRVLQPVTLRGSRSYPSRAISPPPTFQTSFFVNIASTLRIIAGTGLPGCLPTEVIEYRAHTQVIRKATPYEIKSIYLPSWK